MRFGLFGTGYWATTVHGPGLQAHPRARLVGVWGRDRSKTEAAAAGLGAEPYDDPASLLADVDAAAFALPPDVQAGLAAEAALAGRHLLLDKPLALDLAAADRVVEACRAGDAASVVFFTSRFSPALHDWFDQIGRGQWTTALVVHLTTIFGAGSPYANSAWRRERGALWDIGPHALASVTAGLGPVASISAVAGDGDTVAVTAGHRDGGVSCLLLSLTMAPSACQRATTFFGPDGLATVPEDGSSVHDAYSRAVDDLVEMARSGRRDHPCDAGFGREVVRALAAAEASLGGGAVVRSQR